MTPKIIDARDMADGKLIEIPDAPAVPVAAVVLMVPHVLVFFEFVDGQRQLFDIYPATYNPEIVLSGRIKPTATIQEAAAAGLEFGYMLRTATWTHPTLPSTVETETEKYVNRELKGRRFAEARMYPTGLAVQFEDRYLLFTAAGVAVAIANHFTQADTASQQ